jgi:hypothetical protein
MTAEQQQQDSDDTDGKAAAGFSMELPGVRLRLQESTVRLILEYGGGAWRWIVYATAAAIFAYSIGYTWQAFR